MVSPLVENAVLAGFVGVILVVIVASFPWDRVELSVGRPRGRPPARLVYALAAVIVVIALAYSLLVLQQPLLGIAVAVVVLAGALGYTRRLVA